MGLIKGYVRTVEDPTDPAQSIKIKMLSHFELEEARGAKIAEMRERVKALGDLRAALPSLPAAATPETAARKDPLAAYDVRTVLRLGVVSWSYDAELDIALFDEATALFVAREIVAYSKPADDDLGKGSSRSTATSTAPDQSPSTGA